tara:strand:+ start:822 stop:2702 length:1881 start_codon:yes stop_codon:yes gene_type:complete
MISPHEPNSVAPNDLDAMAMVRDAERILCDKWGHEGLRDTQRRALSAVFEGKDTFVLMSTGGGKSVCYVLPALVLHRPVLVISPLISLMTDQVRILQGIGISSIFLGSGQAIMNAKSVALSGAYSVIYITPEMLFTIEVEDVARLNPCLVAVDEAHCASEWGTTDFRPQYGRIGERRHVFSCPLMALTATATPDMMEGIQKSLGMSSDDVVLCKSSFDRPNLSFCVVSRTSNQNVPRQISSVLRTRKRFPAIVYVLTVRIVRDVVSYLEGAGFRVGGYYADMDRDQKASTQASFLNDEIDVLVATIAFGMGINKGNVRFVLNWGPPKSIESYFQQAGRAGRDGLPSWCEMHVHPTDWTTQRHMMNTGLNQRVAESAISAMQTYTEDSSTCRRRLLLLHFGEVPEWQSCGMCDICQGAVVDRGPDQDYGKLARALLLAIVQTGGTFGITKPIDVARGLAQPNHAYLTQLSSFGTAKAYSKDVLRHVADHLLRKKFVGEQRTKAKSGYFYMAIHATDEGEAFLRDEDQELLLPPLRRVSGTPSKGDASCSNAAAPAEGAALDRLKRRRTELSQAAGHPPYVIASDKNLVDMIARNPSSLEQLAHVPGFGSLRVQKYGHDLLKSLLATQ